MSQRGKLTGSSRVPDRVYVHISKASQWLRLYEAEYTGERGKPQAFMDWLKQNGHADGMTDRDVVATILAMETIA